MVELLVVQPLPPLGNMIATHFLSAGRHAKLSKWKIVNDN